MMKTKYPAKITEWGLLMFAATIGISHVPAQFGIAFAFLGWLLEGIVNKNWQIRKDWFVVVLGAYLAWNALSSALSPRPVHSLMALVDNEWPALLMLMMFWTIHESKTLGRLITAFLVSSSIAMVYAVWQSFYGIELYRNMLLDPMERFYRSVGFYGFYLTFAAYAMTVCCVSTAFILESKSPTRWRWLVVPIVSFVAVILTFARSIWLSFAGILPLLGLLSGKKRDLAIAAGSVIVFVTAIAIVPALRHRAVSVFDSGQNATRINLWNTALNMSKDFRVIGIGEDNFDFYFEKYKVEGFYDTTVHAHNDYLTVLVSSGIPGLVLFLTLWGIALKKGIQTRRASKDEVVRAAALGGVLSLGGLLIGALFQNYYGTFVNCLGWWFMTGLVFSAFGIQQDADRANPR